MKKILFLMLALMSAFVSANAQVAIEKSNVLDNVGIGVTVGASTPLDFNKAFPLNPNAGIKITKDITPVIGFQIEGLAIFNDNHFSDIKTFVKATNLGLNGVVNFSNLFGGYNGIPRVFEVNGILGLGWLHTWNTSINSLTAKTGFDLAINMGKKRAHSLVITPAVYWNLHKFNDIQFDKRGGQLALNLTYVYHFKTSNGTHHFKTYDVGAMQSEITYLNGCLDECRRTPKVVTEVIEKPIEKTVKIVTPHEWVVQFAQNSAKLTNEAKAVLNTIGDEVLVDVVGTASPEGTKEYNQNLSQKRAEVVADYLATRGVKVRSWLGKGVLNGESTNRLAIVTVAE